MRKQAECAHAPLIADRFRLRYRDTSLSTSSETTRTLQKTDSWVAAWLEFFFRSTSELLLDVVDEDRGTACLARNGIDGRDALVAKWPRLAGDKTRAVVMSSLDGNGASASAVLGKGFPFITATELQRSFNQPGIWCRQHGARQWPAREVLASRVRLREIWQSDVMASHGHDTDDDGVQRPKDLTVVGRKMRKLSVLRFTFTMATKEAWQKL
jgi:hypothetical protein